MEFRTVYVAFPTTADPPLTVAGRLQVPLTEMGETPARVPAVVICHGSDGVDGRGGFYAQALNASGIATLEIDMWAPRTPVRGAAGRPASVPQTLPDAFGALAFLAQQPEIDPARIAVIGFSWGGVVSLLSATKRYADTLRQPGTAFVAHAAFYPALWSYNRAPGHEFGDLTGAPVLIQAGGADAYDDPDVCDAFLAALAPADRAHVTLVVHEGATHAFDRDLPSKVINDPYAHKGKGGEVLFEFNPQAAAKAQATLVEFLQAAFDRAAFIARFGPVYEASPWVAEGVWPPPSGREALAAAMAAVVDTAPRDVKLALIRAHPELASRAKMAEASVQEQSGAGLDQCSPQEFEAFQRLNAAYNARFGFPFIFAVKGATRADILAAFEARLANHPEAEFATAIAQIHRIAGFRLDDLA